MRVGFSSWNLHIHALEYEPFFGETGTRNLFHIECFTGKDISKHLFMQQQSEILLRLAQQFMVNSCVDCDNDLCVIKLQEADPTFPLFGPVTLPTPLPQPATPIASRSHPWNL